MNNPQKLLIDPTLLFVSLAFWRDEGRGFIFGMLAVRSFLQRLGQAGRRARLIIAGLAVIFVLLGNIALWQGDRDGCEQYTDGGDVSSQFIAKSATAPAFPCGRSAYVRFVSE